VREINDEELLITKDELRHLISEGIEKHLARNTTTVITQRNVFNDLSAEFQDKITDFNFRNDIPSYSARGVTDAIWSSQQDKILAYQIHEYVRKVSLSVMGVKKNEQLLYSELDEVRAIYKKIADTTFDLYVNRIEKQKNLASAENTN
jgi:succinate dehydrogenase/fumarate reductase flavoprotein subunit